MNLFQDVVLFKIACAEYFLEKISTIFLSNQDMLHFETEIVIESFLFFMVASLDAFYDEINKKLNLQIDNHNLTRDLKLKLCNSQSKISDLILIELQKYTQKPNHEEKQITQHYAHDYARKYLNDSRGLDFWERFENRNGVFYEHIWERQNSSLWEIRRLRNQITHSSLIKPSSEIGGFNRSAISLHFINNANKPHEMHFIFNPSQYFTRSINDVKNLVESIRKIITQ